jgi:hypothetical protein
MLPVSTVGQSSSNDEVRVYLTRAARTTLAQLDPVRREALRHGFSRVGRQLLVSAEQVAVEPGWTRRTWPRRRYPQQCYPKTVKFVLDHPQIRGMRLIHGVVSHPPHFVPLDHAWVELPGAIVFDGVVQAFFTRRSYYAVMTALALDAYTSAATRRLVVSQRRPGPWNANWGPTAAQREAYACVVRALREPSVRAPSSGGQTVRLMTKVHDDAARPAL